MILKRSCINSRSQLKQNGNRMVQSAGNTVNGKSSVASKNFETIENNSTHDWNKNSNGGISGGSNGNRCNINIDHLNNGSNGGVEVNVYNSRDSVHSTGDKETAVIFFGFEDSWERDLWSLWLLEVR